MEGAGQGRGRRSALGVHVPPPHAPQITHTQASRPLALAESPVVAAPPLRTVVHPASALACAEGDVGETGTPGQVCKLKPKQRRSKGLATQVAETKVRTVVRGGRRTPMLVNSLFSWNGARCTWGDGAGRASQGLSPPVGRLPEGGGRQGWKQEGICFQRR